ncbi:MAG: GrdX family protein [Clostridia bacterium]|nr:GrdX family protein [Clostridia bacterium]
MEEAVILTNNGAVCEAFPEMTEAVAGGVEDVFIAVRDAVHLGALLISHPLAGSVKPNETPYKSVMLRRSANAVDFRSLGYIEDAIAALRGMPKRASAITEQALRDYALIDLDLMRSARFSYFGAGEQNARPLRKEG